MFEDQIAEALRFLGLKGSEKPNAELIEKAHQFVYLQRQIHANQAEAKTYHERVTGALAGSLYSIFESITPPPRPIRDVLEEALEEAHIPGRAIRGLYYTPWKVLMDFAYPATRLCIVIGEEEERDRRLLLGKGWAYLTLSEEEIRRDPVGAARYVKQQYINWKKVRVWGP